MMRANEREREREREFSCCLPPVESKIATATSMPSSLAPPPPPAPAAAAADFSARKKSETLVSSSTPPPSRLPKLPMSRCCSPIAKYLEVSLSRLNADALSLSHCRSTNFPLLLPHCPLKKKSSTPKKL